MAPLLPGLHSQGQAPRGGSSPSRRRQVRTDLPIEQVRPVAAPVDIYKGRPAVADGRNSEAGQIAAALSQLGGAVSGLASVSATKNADEERLKRARSQVAAATMTEEAMQEAIKRGGVEKLGFDPEAFGRQHGVDTAGKWVIDLEARLRAGENGEVAADQWIQAQLQEQLATMNKAGEGQPWSEFATASFIQASKAGVTRLMTGEVRRAGDELKQGTLSATSGALKGQLDELLKSSGGASTETMKSAIAEWISILPENAAKLNLKQSELGATLLNVAFSYVEEGNPEMIDLIRNSDLGGAIGVLKNNAEYNKQLAGMYVRAKKVQEDRDLEANFTNYQQAQDAVSSPDPATRATSGDIKRQFEAAKKGEGPDFSLSQWNSLFSAARRNDAKIAQADLTAKDKGNLLNDMVSWANDGSLPRMLEIAKSDPNKRAWIPELKDRMLGNINRLPENLRDDVKLKLYKTNPNVFNKDAEWLGTIGTAMNLMGRGENNEANQEAIDKGVALFEKIALDSPGLAEDYVKGDQGRLLEAFVTLKNSGMKQELIETYTNQLQDAYRSGSLKFTPLSNKVIDDNLAANMPDQDDGWIWDSEIANQWEIRKKVGEIASTLMASGSIEPEQAIEIAFKHIKATHDVINDVYVPVNMKDMPPNFEQIQTDLSSTMLANPGAINGVNVAKEMKARAAEGVDDIVWKPISSKNTNVWQMHMRDRTLPSEPYIPVAGVVMSLEEMREQGALLAQNRNKAMVKDIRTEARKKRNAFRDRDTLLNEDGIFFEDLVLDNN